MLNPNRKTKVRAVIKAPCLACLGEGYVAGRVCSGCKGEEVFFIETTENCVEDVDDWSDGPAWDRVVELITANGAETSEDAWEYKIHDAYHDGSAYELTLKIVSPPISKETAAYFNNLIKEQK